MKKLINLKNIIIGILILLVILFGLQCATGGVDKEFFISLIPNVITDLIAILLGTFIISKLIGINEKNKSKEELHKVVGYEYEGLITGIARDYITLIKKEKYELDFVPDVKKVKDDLVEINEYLDDYIDQDFYMKKVDDVEWELKESYDQSSPFPYEKKEVQVPIVVYLRKLVEDQSKQIDRFLQIYNYVLPQELLEKLFVLYNTLQAPYKEYNFILESIEHDKQKKENYKPGQAEINTIQSEISSLGNDLKPLLEYFEDVDKK